MDAEMREHWTKEMNEGFRRYRMPDYMQGGLLAYVLRGDPPGDFLRALLSNNLMETFARADINNSKLIPEYCRFLRWHVPGNCKGSPLRVKEWIAEHEKSRAENATAKTPGE